MLITTGKGFESLVRYLTWIMSCDIISRMDTKRCNTCSEMKPLTDYHKDRDKKGGHKNKCKPCTKKYFDEWKTRPEAKEAWKSATNRYAATGKGRSQYYKKKYGVPVELVDELGDLQEGLCAICKDKKGSHLDHCHETEDVRGLLCRDCNFGLGFFKDSMVNLESAILYLESPPIEKLK